MLSKVIKFFKLINDSYFFNSLLKGTAAGVEHIDFLKLIDVNHIIDVGANKGQFALVSRKFFPDARIDSFEPLKSESDIFEKVFSGDKRLSLK